MNAQELKDKYTMLYDYMAASKKPEYMMAFGKVMTEMMDWMIANKADVAQDMVDKLECIKWNNYLTPKEAEKIVNGMNPKAPWQRDVWKNAMESLGLPVEEEPFYNSCALWAEMNKQHSDHAQTIADLVVKKPLNEIPAEQIVPMIRAFAVDLLKDKDEKYNIREYFKV